MITEPNANQSKQRTFLFLDEMFLMSREEVYKVALATQGYELRLSNSQDKFDDEKKVQSRLKVFKAPGTNWIKYA